MAGIPMDAPNRNYKDPNHKPEVMVALSEFWLLHGFNANLHQILDDHEIFNPLVPLLEVKGLKGLYQYVMELPQSGVDAMLRPLAEKIVPLYTKNQLSKSSPDFWAARVMAEAKPSFENLDRGIFSIYFFNIVQLEPGEAVFQDAGIPHAYLEGQNIELMSNSDNVLRAGLTSKHMDIPELMKHTRFEYVVPHVMHGEKEGKLITFNCPVPDFRFITCNSMRSFIF
jgi:mannose-6-phosphate isomerase